MPDSFEQAHLQHLAAREIELRKQYEDAIQQITAALSQIAWDGENFEIKNYPQILSRINQVVNQLHGSIFTNVVNGITTSWNLSNYKNNLLVDRRLAGKQISITEGQVLYDPNRDALQQFLTRKEKGLNLSDRVWNSLDGYKVEQETALGVGLSEGKSAAELARDMKRYLNEPDRLFRKVRTDSGELKLSRAARNYHPGQGVYRSSYQNALRLTATETNVAYRSADYERWQNIPFVTGIQINLSNNHPEFDICDTLKGKYPKDFKFTGWHPRCLCYQTAIQLSDEEYDKYEDALLAGEEPPQSTQITEPPQAFDDYVQANQERIEGWKNQPYWYKDNKEYIDAAQEGEVITMPKPKFVPAKTILDAKTFAANTLKETQGLNITSVRADKSLTLDEFNKRNEQLLSLSNEYNISSIYNKEDPIKLSFNSTQKYGGYIKSSKSGTDLIEINFGHTNFTTRSQEGVLNFSRIDAENQSIATVTHEFAHLIGIDNQIPASIGRNESIQNFWKELKGIRNDYTKELGDLYRAKGAVETIHLGRYAGTNANEFMAEAFTEYKLKADASKYADLVGKLIDKYFKK